jgi:hypothetical protein
MTPEPRPWPISICTTAGPSAFATSCTLDVEPGSDGAATVGVVADVPDDSPWLHTTAPTVATTAAAAPTANQTRLRRGFPAGASASAPGSSAGGSEQDSPGGAIRWSGSGGGRKSATGGVAGRSRHVRRGGSTGVGVVSTGMAAKVRRRG